MSFNLRFVFLSSAFLLSACGDRSNPPDLKVVMNSNGQLGYLNVSKIKDSEIVHLQFSQTLPDEGTEFRNADLNLNDSRELIEILSQAEVCSYPSKSGYSSRFNSSEYIYVEIKPKDAHGPIEVDLEPIMNSPREKYICGSQAKKIAMLPLALMFRLREKSKR